MTYFLDQPPATFRRAPTTRSEDPVVFAFDKRGSLLVRDDPDRPLTLASLRAAGIEPTLITPLGTLDGVPCAAAVLEDIELPSGFSARSIRRLLGSLGGDRLAVAALASQIAHFRTTNRRCGACGGPMRPTEKDHAVRCDACDRDVYPHVAPCVIVLVHDGPRVLLTRQPRFPPDMYGLVAGYLEPGESLEQCAEREILEEVGVRITDLEYVASQPWPFPSQLMVGMTARYAGGDLVVDKTELEEAAWFDISALPGIPPPFSIARHLIDRFIDHRRGGG